MQKACHFREDGASRSQRIRVTLHVRPEKKKQADFSFSGRGATICDTPNEPASLTKRAVASGGTSTRKPAKDAGFPVASRIREVLMSAG